MTLSRKTRVGVVVDHDAARAPEHHEWQWRLQNDVRGSPQGRTPLRDRTQFGLRPIERADQAAHFPAVGGKGSVVLRARFLSVDLFVHISRV